VTGPQRSHMRRTCSFLALLLAVAVAACAAPQRKPAVRKGSEQDPQYQYEKGVVALNYGLTDEAIRYGKLAVSLDPHHYGGHRLLGHAYYRLGDYAEAEAEYGKAAEIRPDLAEAHFNLGLACVETGALDKAEAEFTQAYSIKEDANAGFYLAKIHFRQKRLDQALEEVQNSIRLDPRSAGAYNLKGVILNQLGRYPEAAGSFQAGLALVPNDTNLQVNLGIAYVNSNELDKARAVFEKALGRIQDPLLKAKVEGYLKSLKDR
jgi:protein O-GlcNAc transferase